jgi:hypothetical protein
MDPGMVDLSPDRLAQLEDKYDRDLQWGIFVGCHVYMHRPLHSRSGTFKLSSMSAGAL